MTIKVEVPLFGTYESDNDLYQAALGCDRQELLDRVREEVTESEYRHTVSRLLDCELAGMVAEWETGARTSERQAEQAALHVRPVDRELVVTSVSDLTPAMRKALLEETATKQTAGALQRRGLISSWDLPRAGSYPLNFTESGRRAAEALRTELDAAPVVPVDEEPMNDLEVDQLTGRPAPEPCGRRWVAEIELCPRCGHDAAAHAVAELAGDRFDPFWVRNLVERVGRELHDLDRLAEPVSGEKSPTQWLRGHRTAFESAAVYLTSAVRQSVEHLGLADLLAAARAGETVAELAAVPQNREG